MFFIVNSPRNIEAGGCAREQTATPTRGLYAPCAFPEPTIPPSSQPDNRENTSFYATPVTLTPEVVPSWDAESDISLLVCNSCRDCRYSRCSRSYGPRFLRRQWRTRHRLQATLDIQVTYCSN